MSPVSLPSLDVAGREKFVPKKLSVPLSSTKHSTEQIRLDYTGHQPLRKAKLMQLGRSITPVQLADAELELISR